MKGRTLIRHAKEGLKNLGRNGWMTFASISAVTITLFIVGIFLLLIMNMNHIATSIEEDVEIRVYIDLTATPEQQEELRGNIETVDHISSVVFLSKEEGLKQFIDSLGDQGEAFLSLQNENPLNDAFVVKAETPQLTEAVAGQIAQFDYIDRINYGQGVVERLFSVTNYARTIGLALILGLMFTAMFLIANTIKLTIVSRKREIQIMKLVGATNGFIRWPFFIEGLFLGVVGSLVPIILIGVGYAYLYKGISHRAVEHFISILPVYPLTIQIGIILLGMGAFIGIWGSMTSVRKFLRI
ncbi:permease-like cell division protein FtsX [Anaerobacillus sp. MEB173]|uniref:permease-like cell division protein FtsX n=1 Tax=Anaerobacillus sp. MEB173 TaxID=3383345 RepID=UPI003F8E80E7